MQASTHSPAEAGSGIDRFMPKATTANAASAGSAPSGFDLNTMRSAVWRNRYIIGGIIVAALLLGVVITMLTTPLYRATTTMRYNPYTSQIVVGQELSDPYIASAEISRYVATLTDILRSRKMALLVVQDLKLDENPAFMDGRTTPPAGQDAAQWKANRQAAAANMLIGGVDATAPANSRVISITFTSDNPALAAAIANSYARSFVMDDLDRGTDENAFARQYLERQISETREKLRETEIRAINYARQNRIIGQPLGTSTSSEEGSSASGTAQTLTASNLTTFNQTVTTARAKRIEAEQRWNSVAGTPAAQLPEVQNNSTVQGIRSEISNYNSQLANLRERYRDDYPEVREMVARIAALNRRLEQTSAEIKNAIRQEYEIARRQEAALTGELNRISDSTLDEQDRRVQYNILNREVSAYRTQLDALMERFNQISAATNIRSTNVTILDPALTPRAPVSPDLMTNLLIALILGIAAGTAVVLLREAMDDRLRSIEEVERKLGLPMLGQTPFIPDHLEDEIGDAFSPISEAYSSIRASLDSALQRQRHLVVQFTSSQASEGKTTTAVTLARKFASLGRRTLLVDMDLRRPSVTRQFNQQRPSSGIVDVLYGRIALERAFLPDTGENLDVLCVGQVPQNPVEILSSGLVEEFFERARAQYDVVIVDSSPVLGIADAPLLSRNVDAVVFVIEANRAHFGQARTAIRRLRDMEAPIIGAILTKYRALEAGQSYDYQYRYYTYDTKTA